MKGLSALVVAALLLGGCKGQSPPGSDPFFGRTTVPAPPTGAVPGRGADPYYRGAPSGATVPSPTPQWSTPSPGVLPGGTGSGNKYAPPSGNLNYQGTSTTGQAAPAAAPAEQRPPAAASAASSPSVVRIVEPEGKANPSGATGTLVAASDAKAGADVAAAPSTAAGAPASTAGAVGGASLAGRPMVVRTLQAKPRPSDATPGSPAAASTSTAAPTGPASVGSTTFAPTAATPAGFTPRSAPTPARSVDIMDLPPAGSSTSSTGAGTATTGGTVRPVSAVEGLGARGEVVPAGGASHAKASSADPAALDDSP